jgi:hypothetical protein
MQMREIDINTLKERIGKKYQWLALYEVLARISDNVLMEDESTRWSENKKYVQYQGTWQPSVRNIDPTVIQPPSENFQFNPNAWWNPIKYDDWCDDSPDWVSSSDNLPDLRKIIELQDEQGDEWLALEIHPKWNQSVPIGCEQYEHPHKRLWCQIRSYFVREKQARTIIDWAKQQHFMGRWFPESHEQSGIFSREHYWSPAYHFFNRAYYGRSDWETVNNGRYSDQKIGKVMVTTERHYWEAGAESPLSYLAPRKCLFEKLQLQYSNKMGEWKNSQGEVICFDPTIHQDENNCLLIRKTILLQFLKDNKLKIFWTCLGQKQIIADATEQSQRVPWFEFSEVFALNGEEVHHEQA